MPVWFEYEPRNTWMHRMNPLAKLALIISFLGTISFIWDVRILTIYAIIAGLLYVTSKTPGKWMLLAIPFGLYRFIEALIYGFTMTNPAFYKNTPYHLAITKLFIIGPYNILGATIGPLTIIYGSFLFALAYIFRIVITMAITFVFIYSTSLNELIKNLPKLKVIPSQIIFVIVVALKFVPEIWREFNLTSKAQSLRGWKLKTKNPVKMFKMAAPIVNPFTRKMVMYVDRLTLTVQIRGFGTGSVKYPWKIKIGILDWLIIIISIVSMALILYGVAFYGFAQL